jgi:cellulose synthase operon protein C
MPKPVGVEVVEKDELLEYLETRLRDNPKSLLFARLADCYLNRGNTDDALVLCNEGVKHHPYYTTGYFLLAKTHVLRKEYDKAEAALKKVLSHDQQYLSAQKLLADILVKTGWEAAASEHYASVIDADPMEDRVRDLVNRYAVPQDRTKPESTEAAVREPEPEPRLEFESESEPPTPKPEAVLREEPVSIRPPAEMETDWTDQIREFSPEDIDLPIPPPVVPPETTSPTPRPAQDFPVENQFPLPETSEPDDGNAVESLLPDVEEPTEPSAPVAPSASGAPESDRTAKEVIDFTQNWFDLSTFDNLEENKPGAAVEAEKESDLDLEILDEESEVPEAEKPAVPPSPESAGPPLFEKKASQTFLNPSDLEPVKPVPWFKSEKPAVPKTPPAAPPEPSVSQRLPAPDSGTPSEPDSPPKAEERADMKIVTSTLGEIYAAQGQFEKAIEVYEALLEKSPKETRYKDKIADLKKRLKEASGK